MLNYDFKILNYNEFECFTRDLLQASEHLRIESFAEGRDGGIDLRFAYDSTKKCIVQCKRYKDWNELKNTLKKEVDKVKKINPDRYILSTSVDLTAKNKDEIKELFSPYIKDTAKDILGQSDLNNLLGQHHEIEKQYYKLWLGSSNVLETIVHKNVINWSEFELDEIKSEIAKYVTNDSFYQAEKILTENRYVIISGIPGIGKTTLARMLVYNYLAHGYEEFIYVVDDLDNASKVYEKNKKQVFFFDDFLGSNFFDIQKQSTSFENKLITFINRIKKSPNSLFIMTTREYILSDAKNYYEKLDLNKIDIAKCTIDLSNYTELVRAKILYNHLAEANMPSAYIDVLIEDKNYEQIIKHPNFNPRVIEAFINQKIWNDISPENFMTTVIVFFDKPLSVWEKAFENLNPFARYSLVVFATFGGHILFEEWQEAFKYFCKTTHSDIRLGYDDILWKRTVNILQDCFIKIKRTETGSLVIIPFNPSVMDFCVSYINECNNETTLCLLLKSILYPEQLTSIYTDGTTNHKSLKWQVEIPTKFLKSLGDVILSIRNRFKSRDSVNNRFWSDTSFYERLVENIPSIFQHLEGFLEDNYDFQELMASSIPLSSRLKLMRVINWNIVSMNSLYILQNIIENNNEILESYEWQDLFETIDALGLSAILRENAICAINDQVESEFNRIENSYDCERLYRFIYDINKELLYNEKIRITLDDISEKESQFIYMGENNNKIYQEPVSNKVVQNKTINTIHEMFTSLYND